MISLVGSMPAFKSQGRRFNPGRGWQQFGGSVGTTLVSCPPQGTLNTVCYVLKLWHTLKDHQAAKTVRRLRRAIPVYRAQVHYGEETVAA